MKEQGVFQNSNHFAHIIIDEIVPRPIKRGNNAGDEKDSKYIFIELWERVSANHRDENIMLLFDFFAFLLQVRCFYCAKIPRAFRLSYLHLLWSFAWSLGDKVHDVFSGDCLACSTLSTGKDNRSVRTFYQWDIFNNSYVSVNTLRFQGHIQRKSIKALNFLGNISWQFNSLSLCRRWIRPTKIWKRIAWKVFHWNSEERSRVT